MTFFLNTIFSIFLACEGASLENQATTLLVEAGMSPRISGIKIWGHDYSTEYVALTLFFGFRLQDFSLRAIGQTASSGPSLGYTGGEADWRFWQYSNGIGSMFVRLTFGNQSFFHEPMVARKTDRLEAGFLIGSEFHLYDKLFVTPAIGFFGGAYTKSTRKSLFDAAYVTSSLSIGVKI